MGGGWGKKAHSAVASASKPVFLRSQRAVTVSRKETRKCTVQMRAIEKCPVHRPLAACTVGAAEHALQQNGLPKAFGCPGVVFCTQRRETETGPFDACPEKEVYIGIGKLHGIPRRSPSAAPDRITPTAYRAGGGVKGSPRPYDHDTLGRRAGIHPTPALEAASRLHQPSTNEL